MNASPCTTEAKIESWKAEVKTLADRNVKLSERNLELAEMVTDLQGVIADLKEEIREVIAQRNASVQNNMPVQLLREAVAEYRELVDDGETNKYVWMGAESRLDRAMGQVHV